MNDNENSTCGRTLGKRCSKTHPRMSFTNDAKGGSLRSLKPFSAKDAQKKTQTPLAKDGGGIIMSDGSYAGKIYGLYI